jgi:hypothetical protein
VYNTKYHDHLRWAHGIPAGQGRQAEHPGSLNELRLILYADACRNKNRVTDVSAGSGEITERGPPIRGR